MGLGKTIQAMAFLAYLAEEKNIWGPFLFVAPTSVLNNWTDEFGCFCPNLKTLSYWGGIQERTVLRKNINPKRLYRMLDRDLVNDCVQFTDKESDSINEVFILYGYCIFL